MNNVSCLFCNTSFETKQYNKQYCNTKCQRKSKINKKKQYQTTYYQTNREFIKKYNEQNKERIAETNAKWYKKNCELVKEKISRREKYYLQNNTNYLIAKRLRTRLNCAIRNDQKSGSAVSDLGCSIEELKKHLESQFQENMSWDNYGLKGWHIDHIKALANFDLSNREELLKACHYTNLQPLWANDNWKKGNKNEY